MNGTLKTAWWCFNHQLCCWEPNTKFFHSSAPGCCPCRCSTPPAQLQLVRDCLKSRILKERDICTWRQIDNTKNLAAKGIHLADFGDSTNWESTVNWCCILPNDTGFWTCLSKEHQDWMVSYFLQQLSNILGQENCWDLVHWCSKEELK